MPIEIQELTSHIEVIDRAGVLSPQTVNDIVRAVIKALKAQDEHEKTHQSEIDTRSIVEQQRGGRR